MPSKYVVRNLRENSYYHVYNIGVANSVIFLENQDYETFLYYLFIYTSPRETVEVRYPDLPKRFAAKNLSEEILVVAYCLMPNHFHLLLKQKTSLAMPKMMKQVINGYTTYFNVKYKRAGSLLRGRYKSILVESEYLLVQMTRFVHLNPAISGLCRNPGDYAWSSYKNPLHTNEVINRFGTVAEWDTFHLDNNSYHLNLPKIRHLTID
jgi:putative transposase